MASRGSSRIHWAPGSSDRFVVKGGSDVRLYSTRGDSRGSTVLEAVVSDFPHNSVTAFAWCCNEQRPLAYFIGLQSGRVLLSDFQKLGDSDSQLPAAKCFLPHSARAIISLSWCEQQSNLLLSGSERTRGESVALWDIEREGSDTSSGRRPVNRSLAPAAELPWITEASVVSEPLRVFQQPDACVCSAWLPSYSSSFATGGAQRHLRVFDARAAGRPAAQVLAHSRAVVCVQTNPAHQDALLSAGDDGSVKVWDCRSLSSPLAAISTPVRGMDVVEWWDAARGTCFVTSSGNGAHIISVPEFPPRRPKDVTEVSLSRTLHSLGDAVTASVCPQLNSVVACVLPGPRVVVRSCLEAVPIGLGQSLVAGFGDGSVIHCYSDVLSDDIKDRANAGYCLDPRENAILCGNRGERELALAWAALAALKENHKGSATAVPGVLNALNATASTKSLPTSLPLTAYGGPVREKVIATCGGQRIGPFAETLSRLSSVNPARSALISIAELSPDNAVKNLTTSTGPGADSRALAAACIMTACASKAAPDLRGVLPKVENPYIRALLSVLSGDTASVVDAENGIDLCDRVLLACRFMENEMLMECLDRLARKSIAAGQLDALLLTGISPFGVELLANYVDRTSDVQTAALMMAASGANETGSEWITTYRDLLDRKSAWRQRAEFDVALAKAGKHVVAKTPRIVAKCNFCQEPLLLGSGRGAGRGGGRGAGGFRLKSFANRTPAAARPQSCPSCRRSMPRCSICQLHLGCTNAREPQESGSVGPDAQGVGISRRSKFGTWFSWCMRCKHGAHADCASKWFESHRLCPVPGCDCPCQALDRAL